MIARDLEFELSIEPGWTARAEPAGGATDEALQRLFAEIGPQSVVVQAGPTDGDVSGHSTGGTTVEVVVRLDDDDTEGHAFSLRFPSQDDAQRMRTRLAAGGLLIAVLAVGTVSVGAELSAPRSVTIPAAPAAPALPQAPDKPFISRGPDRRHHLGRHHRGGGARADSVPQPGAGGRHPLGRHHPGGERDGTGQGRDPSQGTGAGGARPEEGVAARTGSGGDRSEHGPAVRSPDRLFRRSSVRFAVRAAGAPAWPVEIRPSSRRGSANRGAQGWRVRRSQPRTTTRATPPVRASQNTIRPARGARPRRPRRSSSPAG